MNLRDRLQLALDEDLGPGDLTTEACFAPKATASAAIVAKEPLVVSGLEAVRLAFEVAAQRYSAFVVVTPEVQEGDAVAKGAVVARVHGSVRAILTGERLALNLLMRMSGIATHVRDVLASVGPTTFRAVDTRKTTPLWRDLEKAAVRHGGGHNHRFGLYDGVLVKDNHIAAAGGVREAVVRIRDAVHHLVRIEVEVTSQAQIDVAMEAGADGVLLDNMDDTQIEAAVAHVRATWPHAFVEASGGMDAARMKALAASGLDVVSVGGFIHRARWVDLSLEVTA